jgi:hypothetical protein
MAKQIVDGNLEATGVLDNVAAQLSVFNGDVQTVDKSVWLYGIGIGAGLGFMGGIATEARGITVPVISPMLRPKNRSI